MKDCLILAPNETLDIDVLLMLISLCCGLMKTSLILLASRAEQFLLFVLQTVL